MDISILDVQKNGLISDITYVLEVEIHLPFAEMSGLGVWRNHEGAVTGFTCFAQRPLESFTDGTYFADVETGTIYGYTNRFSTYAVTFKSSAGEIPADSVESVSLADIIETQSPETEW